MKLKNIYLILLSLQTLVASATSYQYTDTGIGFAWGTSNYVGVYSASGSIIKYNTNALQSDNHYITISSGFGIVDNTTFYAYSPYNSNNYNKSMSALPAVYTDQKQSSNGATDHLSVYDYQIAKFTTGTGSATINFSHVGSVLHFTWKIPVAGTFKSLALKSDAEIFTTDAAMNLTTQKVTSTATTDSVTMTLDDIAIEKDGTIDASMFIFPDNLKGKTIVATLTATDGTIMKTVLTGTTLLAGKVYPIAIGTDGTTVIPVSSEAKSFPTTSSTTSVASITAYSPDFTLDTTNKFVVVSKGDVNKDGVVNTTDAVMIINYYLGKTTEIDKNIADVNDDNDINTTDAVLIINKYLNK